MDKRRKSCKRVLFGVVCHHGYTRCTWQWTQKPNWQWPIKVNSFRHLLDASGQQTDWFQLDLPNFAGGPAIFERSVPEPWILLM